MNTFREPRAVTLETPTPVGGLEIEMGKAVPTVADSKLVYELAPLDVSLVRFK